MCGDRISSSKVFVIESAHAVKMKDRNIAMVIRKMVVIEKSLYSYASPNWNVEETVSNARYGCSDGVGV